MNSSKVQKKNGSPFGVTMKTMWLLEAYCELAKIFDDELCLLMDQNKFPRTLKAAQAITEKIRKRAGDAQDTRIFHALEPALKLSSRYESGYCTEIESAIVELPFISINRKLEAIGEWDMECIRVRQNDGKEFKLPVLDVIPGRLRP